MQTQGHDGQEISERTFGWIIGINVTANLHLSVRGRSGRLRWDSDDIGILQFIKSGFVWDVQYSWTGFPSARFFKICLSCLTSFSLDSKGFVNLKRFTERNYVCTIVLVKRTLDCTMIYYSITACIRSLWWLPSWLLWLASMVEHQTPARFGPPKPT